MRRRTVSLLLALSSGIVLSGHAAPGNLSRAIRLDDWALADWAAIRAGQLSVTHAAGGDELRVDALTSAARHASSSAAPRPKPPIPSASPAQVPSAQSPRDRALWVWNTADILGNSTAEQALLEFAQRNRVTLLFVQLPDEPSHRQASGEIPIDASRWKPFLARLGGHGVRVHALSGAPDDALPDRHGRVLSTVRNIIAYNAAAAPAERFAGIHYDIEPYLLPGFRGGRRQRILTDYLDLLTAVAARARAAGIEFGVDIPFWYDAPDELTGEVPLVDYHGATKPASEQVIDLVDFVVVMSYRTTGSGADSIAALADGELSYADAKGKRAFIGLETTVLPDEDMVEFDGEPGRGLPELAPADRAVVIQQGRGADALWLATRDGWHGLQRDLSGSPATGADRSVLWWPVRRVVAVPAARLTFARLGAARLDEAMRQALDDCRRHASFGGFCIHDYLGYRTLLSLSSASR